MKRDHEKPLPASADAAATPSLSRRKFLKVSMTGATLAGTAGLAACVAPPEMRTVGTTPKPVALYQDFPNRGRRCAGCTHFLEPNGCKIVAGEISPNGWCRFYERLRA